MVATNPTDLPEGSQIVITVEHGVFVARFRLKDYKFYTGIGEGVTVEEAIREALDTHGPVDA